MMNLARLFSDHKSRFRQKFVEALARANEMAPEQADSDFKESIDSYVDEKYEKVQQLADKIIGSEKPVLLNIRRGREREDKCKLCEGNQPNIDEIVGKYGDGILVIEVPEDNIEGNALYHMIFHEEAAEKKVPLTAVIKSGEILKFWAGKTVEPAVYEMYIRKALA